MQLIDWIIVIIPVIAIIGLAIYSKKYVRGVVDYIAAGRVAGRYVISVGDMTSHLSILMLVAWVESKYKVGLALTFWEYLVLPIGIVLGLTGYCTYRFRETKALSIGQFLEMRYSRGFRIVASTLRTLAEMMTNAIGPAIAANFFIYFLGLPHHVKLLGLPIPTFTLVVAIILTLCIIIMWSGGRIALLISDCLQGLISYPIFVVIAGYVLITFSWNNEIAPVMMDRIPGESFINPFDISELRDFNMFAISVFMISKIVNHGSWLGNDASNCGRSPHEQKMAGVLGAWRAGLSTLMCLLIAITIITVMNHRDFADKAHQIRREITEKVAEETIADSAAQTVLNGRIAALPVARQTIGTDAPLSQEENIDTAYIDTARDAFPDNGDGNFAFQKFRTLYHQMMMPVALRNMLPTGLMGLFCLLMIMLMLSTDDSRIFNASATIIQDLVQPLLKTPMTPKQHLLALRLCSAAVAVFFFFCSIFFANLDYILMFITIMTGVWLGGAGPVMIFGLYSRFGTTAGAYCCLLFGSGFSLIGLLVQRNWAARIYPFLDQHGWVEPVDRFLENASAPFNPYIVWEMSAVKFPINSKELYFMAILLGFTAYIVASLMTRREPFNLERMLHRGEYSTDGYQHVKSKWTLRTVFGKLIGITPHYTRGDKVIAWSVFGYAIVYQIGICFIGVLIWNLVTPWKLEWWSTYFFINSIVVTAVLGIVTTVWFLWGGIIDTKRLFKDLALRKDNPLDDGRVEGHVSLADKAAFEEKTHQPQDD